MGHMKFGAIMIVGIFTLGLATPSTAEVSSSSISSSIPSSVRAKASMSYRQAKRDCLKEDGSLKGKALQSCIKRKQNR